MRFVSRGGEKVTEKQKSGQANGFPVRDITVMQKKRCPAASLFLQTREGQGRTVAVHLLGIYLGSMVNN